MSIYKDNVTGKWRVVYRYTDWTGETHQSSKGAFSTKREALMWERELLLKKEAKLDMTFESFYRQPVRVHRSHRSCVGMQMESICTTEYSLIFPDIWVSVQRLIR